MYASAAALLVPLVVRGAHDTAGVAAAIRSLSDNDAVQYILSDIPFFAVGILAFGVLTFFLSLRRVTWVVLALHLSAALCFTAAILDLIQVLFRGHNSTASDNTDPVLGLDIAREILYAVSAGARYLFLWGIVAWPPYGENAVGKVQHSGSWGRWGIFGHFLKWILLAVVFAIMTLQILFRVLPALEHFGPVYQVEVTMEIIISAVFILKLLMNSYLVGISAYRLRPGLMAVVHYLPLIAALGLSIGIGIGGLFEFRFTETMLGRFLQAIELYILILYVLVYSFLDFRDTPLPSPLRNRSSSFQALPPVLSRDSSFRIPPPRVSTPDLETAMQSRIAPVEPMPVERRPSFSTRLSTWIGNRRVSQKLGMGAPPPLSPSAGARLWNQSEAEKGMTSVDLDAYEIEIKPRRSSVEQSPTEPKESARYQDPLFTSIVRETPVPGPSGRESSLAFAGPSGRASSLTFAPAQSPAPSPEPSPAASPIASPVHPVMSIEIPPPIPTASDETNSPIYGLNGIVRPVGSEPSPFDDREDPRTYFERSPRSSDGVASTAGLSGLLRQQEELDRSIAALRLFTSPSSRRTSLSSETPKPPSAAQSDFSLSNFPSPPWRRSYDTKDEATPTSSRSAMANAERTVQVVPPNVNRRSHAPSLALMPGEDAPQQVLLSPPLTASSRTPYEAPSSVFNSLQPAFNESRETENEDGYVRRSRNLLQPINESQRNIFTSTRLSPTPDTMSLSSAGMSTPPLSVRRQLPTPPLSRPPPQLQSGGRGTIPPVGPTNVPRLASGKVGLPSRPRLADRNGASPPLRPTNLSGVPYERPRPVPSPLARPPI